MWLELDDGFVIGEGGLDLLVAIATYGSLRRASLDVGWSYRHAWGYLRRAERTLGGPLARAMPGKGEARGMVLSDAGERLVHRLTRLKALAKAAVAND